jgi:hypothetical protein
MISLKHARSSAVFLVIASVAVVPVAEAQALRLAPVASIGEFEGDERRVFGTVTDAVADGAGRVLILDARTQRLSSFARDGEFLASFGRGGRGPGEFFTPRAVDIGPGDRIYVLDSGNQRVEVVELRGREFVRTHAFRLDFHAMHLCATPARVYVLGFRDGMLIHEFDAGGQRLRSFGTALAGDHPVLSNSFARGSISCIEDEGLIVLLPSLVGAVWGFSMESGRELWRLPIPDYREVVIEHPEPGAVRFTTRDGRPNHMGSRVVPLSRGRALLQIGILLRGAREAHAFSELTSYVLTLDPARIQRLAQPLPRVVASSGRTLLATTEDPFPRLLLYEFSLGSQR